MSRCSTRRTIIDNATYEKPHQYASGVEFVIVNGKMVLEHGQHSGARPGAILVRTGEEAVRLKPATCRRILSQAVLGSPMQRSLLIVWMVTFAAFAADRDAAEWVIRKGGHVMVNGGRQPISLLAELPAGTLSVTGVDLSGTVLAPKDLEHLAGLEHVRELYLPGSAFTPGAGSKLEGNAELKVIAGMKDLERLQFSLHFLPYFNVTDAGFATFSNLTNLKELRCEQCKVDKRGLDPFVNLESLDMSYSTFGNSAMSSLEGMHNLRRLYLRDTSVTDEGLKHIAGLTRLEELDLYGVRVTDRGIAYLKDLKELRKLILLGAPITDESIPVIAGMAHLRELNLYRSRVTNSGLARLAGLHELSAVDLRYSRVTAGGVDTLRAAVPACEIEFVGAAPAQTNAKAAKPSGSGEKALAAWISSLGGKTVFAGGKLREVSLAALRIGDAQVGALAGACGNREVESGSHRGGRSRAAAARAVAKSAGAEYWLHHRLRCRTGASGGAHGFARAAAERDTGDRVRLRAVVGAEVVE